MDNYDMERMYYLADKVDCKEATKEETAELAEFLRWLNEDCETERKRAILEEEPECELRCEWMNDKENRKD